MMMRMMLRDEDDDVTLLTDDGYKDKIDNNRHKKTNFGPSSLVTPKGSSNDKGTFKRSQPKPV